MALNVHSLLIFLAGLLFTIYNPLFAQTTEQYHSMATYDRSSTELIARLKEQLSSEFEAGETSEVIRKTNNDRLNYLKALVGRRMFIQDQSLETFVNDIVSQLAAANQLEERPRTVLLMRTRSVNAFTYGKGIFIVTLGMLGRINAVDELALALAHEMAHDELDHIRQKIQRRAESERKGDVSESIKKVLIDESEDYNAVEIIRQSISERSHFSQKAEIEADSLGTSYFTRAGYSPIAGEFLFDILNNPTALNKDIGVELLLPLHSEQYPLQDEWFIGKFSEYNAPSSMLFGVLLDSLESHPDIELRRMKFLRYDYERPVAFRPRCVDVVDINREAQFELVEICYQQKLYVRSMFYALQLLSDDPGNTHLISRVAKMLLDMRTWKEGGTMIGLVVEKSSRFSDELKLFSNMIHNISVYDTGELAYYFIANKTHFNTDDPSHYYLKWKLCLATKRRIEAKAVKNQYREHFKSAIEAYRYQ